MDILINFSPTGEGIQSVMSDNLTCTCEYSSCNCFHNNFRYTEPEHVKRMDGKEGSSLDKLTLTSSPFTQVFVMTTVCSPSQYQPVCSLHVGW